MTLTEDRSGGYKKREGAPLRLGAGRLRFRQAGRRIFRRMADLPAGAGGSALLIWQPKKPEETERRAADPVWDLTGC